MGNWSDGTRWLDGTAPAFGGDDTLAIRFAEIESGAITSQLDLGVFSLNTLGFDTRYAASVQLTSAVGSALRFSGIDSALSFEGLANVTLSAPLTLAGSSASLRITGHGLMPAALSGVIGEEAGRRGLRIDVAASRADLGVVQLAGANTFTGGVELRSGNLAVNHANALGSGALTVRGGTLRLGASTLANDAILHSDLVLADSANATWSGAISSAVAGTGLTLRGGGTLTLTGASTYSGETTLDFSLTNVGGNIPVPRLTLAAGSSLQSSAFNIRAGLRLTIEANTAGVTNRIADTAPIRLSSGQLRFSDPTGNATAKSETGGAISLAGHSTIALASGAFAVSTLNVASFARPERGTLLVAGVANTSGNGRLLSTAAPNLVGGGGASGPSTSIVPWAIGDSGADLTGSSFVTYSAANGFRLLNTASDYTTGFSTNQNTRLTSAATLPNTLATINSLWLAGGSLSGAGRTLTLTSGALASTTTGTISVNLNFGAEAMITPLTGSLILTGSLNGANGLTKSGAGMLSLQGSNTITGPLTINAGLIVFNAVNRLGNISGITINGTDAGLNFLGSSPDILASAFALNSGIAAIQNNNATQLTLSGATSGAGGWALSNVNVAGRIQLSGAAAHTGPTLLTGGTFSFGADAALGAGDLKIAGNPTIDLSGAWTTGRSINLASALALKTNGFNTVWSGPLTGSGAITKTTPGNLRIESPTGLTSEIFFNSGRLEIGGPGTLKSSSITLTGGAALVFDNAAQAANDRLAGVAPVTLQEGELRLEGNATAPVIEKLGTLTFDYATAGARRGITITAPGTAGATLEVRSRTNILRSGASFFNAPPIVVRGNQLGGPAGTAFTRFVVTSLSGLSSFQPSYLVDDLNGLATSFAIYDGSTDAAGQIGFRPLLASEYSDAASIQNPVNGGATPTDAHLLLSGAGGAIGASNSAQTLTLAAGSALTLAPGQTLSLSRGTAIARAGAAPVSISGGTLHGGAGNVSVYVAGELALGSNVTAGTGVFQKHGPGALVVQSGANLPANVQASEGAIRISDDKALADAQVFLASAAQLELTAPGSVGGLSGSGNVQFGAHTLTLGTAPADSTFSGTIAGSGALRIVDGGRVNARRTLSGANTFSGGVMLDSGVLALGNAQALGPGPVAANGGGLASTGTSFILNNTFVLNSSLSLSGLTLGPNASISGSGALSGTNVRLQGVIDFPGTAVTTSFITFSGSSSSTGFFVDSPGGSLRPRGGLTIGANGAVSLASSSTVAGGALADDVPLLLRGGRLQLANTTETIGPLRVAGFSTLNLSPTDTGSAMLSAASLERVGSGTIEIIANKTLGTAGAGSGFVRFATPPPTTDGGVLPYAIGQGGVVVYDPVDGVRQLASHEFTTSIAAATPASHLRVTSANAVNSGALTVRTLTLGVGITGGGSIAVTSGLVIGGSSVATDNAIFFGSNEAFIAIPGSRFTSSEFWGPVSGTGGLTVFGRGLVAFSGGNQISGPLAVQGAARILLQNAAQLGPDTSAIQIDGRDTGAGFQVNSGRVTVSRPIQVNSGFLAVSAPFAEGQLVLNGPISGPGGIFAGDGYGPVNSSLNFGFTVLAGANSYSGPTVVEGNLAFPSDAALGNTRAVILSGGTIKLLGDWDTARRIEFSTLSGAVGLLDTNGFQATFRGLIAKPSFAQPILKRGAGDIVISTPQDEYNGQITVQAGRLVLGEAGRLTASRVAVSAGAALTIDHRGQVAPRGNFAAELSDAAFQVLGNATQPTSLGLTLIGTSGLSTITLLPQAGTPLTFDNASAYSDAGAWLLVRGDQLGTGTSGGYTRFRFPATPTPFTAVQPGVLVDTRADGGGTSFAIYDSALDAVGIIGLRPLRAAEYANGAEIRNPASGGAIPADASFLASGNVTTGGGANTLNTLTLEPGAQLAMSAGQTLTLSQNALLVREGAAASILGGTLQPSVGPLAILGGGELRFGAVVPEASGLRLFGPGVLTVTAPQPSTLFTVSGGSLRVAAGDPLALTKVQLDAAGRLELNGVSTRIPELIGTGTVELGGATLSLTGNFPTHSASTFAGAVTGAGTLAVTGNSGVTLTGASPYTGALVVNRGNLTLSGSALGVNSVSIQSGTLYLDSRVAGTGLPQLDSPAVALNSGTLFLYSAHGLETVAPFGQLTGEGLNYARIETFSNDPGGRMIFSNLARQNRGTFVFDATGPSRHDFSANLSGLLVGNPAIPTQRPVLPFGTVNGRPATFEPGVGLRALSAAEQSSALIAGDNVLLSQFITFNGDITVNSLDSTNVVTGLFGSGIVRVASGLINGGGTFAIALDFGDAEGLIFNTVGGARYNSAISGRNGLTVSTRGEHTTVLHGPNSFTGPLTVNGGRLSFNSATNLGADSSPIILHDARLVYDGADPFTLHRGIELRSAFGGLELSPGSTAQWTLMGPISGAGMLLLDGDITLANPANSYSGLTVIDGTTRFASDAVFGQSPALAFIGGVLSPSADWTTAREVRVGNEAAGSASSGAGTIDTGAFTTTLNGPLTGFFQLAKEGAGRLIVNDGDAFSGPLVINSGAVQLNGPIGAGSNITVAEVARLEGNAIFDRTILLNGTLAPGTSAGVLEIGDLRFASGSVLEMEYTGAALFDQVRVNGSAIFDGLAQLVLGFGNVSLTDETPWPILLNDGVDPIAVSSTQGFALGTNVLEENETFFVGNQALRITYSGGDGNDIVLTVPEPGVLTALVFGLGALFARRPNRKRS